MNRIIGHLCAHRLNWARRTSWRWWDAWDDTALQTHDSKLEPWRFEVEYATSRSQRLPTIMNPYEWAGKKHVVSLKHEGQSGIQTSYRARSAVRQWFNVGSTSLTSGGLWNSAGSVLRVLLGKPYSIGKTIQLCFCHTLSHILHKYFIKHFMGPA